MDHDNDDFDPNDSRSCFDLSPVNTCSDPCPPASTSSPVMEENFAHQTGIDFLRRSLLGKFETGICASPFNDNLERLRHLLIVHGISGDGYSIMECRSVFFQHVFSGDCILRTSHHKDFTACSHFSNGFESEEEMSFAAFDIVASARSDQRTDDDLFFVLRVLQLSTEFHVAKTR